MTGEMTIENVINRSCINLHMKGRDKKEVIEEMAEMFDLCLCLTRLALFPSRENKQIH